MRQNSPRDWAFVWRITLLASTLGLGVGLYEAAFLRMTPRINGLTQPDVESVIWFLAPFAAACSFTLLGLVAGIVAFWINKKALYTIVAASVWGLAGAYLAAAPQMLEARSGWLIATHDLISPAIWFVVLFGWGLLSTWAGRLPGSRLTSSPVKIPLRPWATSLLLTMAILIVGIGFHSIREPRHRDSADTTQADASRKPNIVLITLDTVRADHLSSYGYSRPTTPNLDRIARQAVVFENAVSSSSWTLPAVSSIFTSLLPHQHGANAVTPLEKGVWTLAEILRDWGYETAGFNANPYYGLAGWGMAQGFETYMDDSTSLRHNLAATIVGRVLIQPIYETFIRYNHFDRRDAAELNKEVCRWLQHRSTRPFFLFINYFDAHRPYAATPPYDRRFGQIPERLLRKMDSERYGRLPEPLTEEEQMTLIKAYDNCLAFLDSQLGELWQNLAQSPAWSNTYLIITADHGDGFNEHGAYDHGWNLYRESVHVPLLVAGPRVPRGLRVRHIARTRQIFATVLDMAANRGVTFQRSSLRRFWRPGFEPDAYDNVAISELIDYAPSPDRTGFISIMTDEWHYLHGSQGRSELYHWPTDPEEKMNMADSPSGQQTAQDLRNHVYYLVERSVRPWRGLSYLLALNRPGYSVLQEAFRVDPWEPGQPRIGMDQTRFHPDPPSTPPKMEQDDEEMIKAIPYY